MRPSLPISATCTATLIPKFRIMRNVNSLVCKFRMPRCKWHVWQLYTLWHGLQIYSSVSVWVFPLRDLGLFWAILQDPSLIHSLTMFLLNRFLFPYFTLCWTFRYHFENIFVHVQLFLHLQNTPVEMVSSDFSNFPRISVSLSFLCRKLPSLHCMMQTSSSWNIQFWRMQKLVVFTDRL
jgi:hypothetical protein